MRIGIVGPGGIGGYFGNLLARESHDIMAIALRVPTPHHVALPAILKPHALGRAASA